MATDVTFGTNLDASGNEIRNVKFQVLASDPASPGEARFYYNSVAKELRWFDGSAWIPARAAGFGSISGTPSFGQANANGSAGTAARSDHQHALPAHDNAAHSAVALSALAVPAADVPFNSKKITGLASGTNTGDAVNKGQLDGKANTSHTHAQSDITNLTTDLAAKAPLASPALTGTPTAPTATAGTDTTQIATTAFVQAAVQASAAGLDVKASVRVAVASGSAGTYNNAGGTAGNGQFTAAPLTVDGVTLAAGDRVLVMGSASATGIYTVVTAGTGSNGTWNRAADFDSQAEVTPNAFTFVEEGTSYADSGWVLTTNGAITVGGPLGTPMSWTQFTGAGQITAGAGLTKTGNSLDVGAGTGISVAADTVAIDTAVVARKYSTDLTGSATTYTVTHNLGTRDVQVSVRETASPYGGVLVAWEADTSNTVKLYFASAPASGAFRATVIG